jgi:hypothetical protein
VSASLRSTLVSSIDGTEFRDMLAERIGCASDLQRRFTMRCDEAVMGGT